MTRSTITATLLALSLGLSGCSRGETPQNPEPDVAANADSGGTERPASRPAADPTPEADPEPAEPARPKLLQVGDTAPDFTLANLAGDLVQLETFKGKRIVLEWFNPECPYTRYSHLEGSLKEMSSAWTAKGVVWLTINSSAPGLQGHGRDMNGGFKSKFRIANDILLDESGRVGHLYGAKRTPQVFLIDEKGIVVYLGAVDNQPMGSLLDGQSEEINYLERALQDLEAKRVVVIPKKRAFGCSVRYAKSGG